MGLTVHLLERLHWSQGHGEQAQILEKKKKRIALVGSPNVGKSVLFHRLTGTYVTVSNYPGTTVEVYRAMGTIGEEAFEFIDTPGMYSLLPITEEERVARLILLRDSPDLILHVVDAKNLERMLLLTLQLLETGIPVILVLNIMDEAERLGLRFRLSPLGESLRRAGSESSWPWESCRASKSP